MPSPEYYFWNEIAVLLDQAQTQGASFYQAMTIYLTEVVLVALVIAGLVLVVISAVEAQEQRTTERPAVKPAVAPNANPSTLQLSYEPTQ